LLFHRGSLLLWYPAAADIIDATKAGFILKEDLQGLCFGVFCKE
jgi:hypothetical protein